MKLSILGVGGASDQEAMRAATAALAAAQERSHDRDIEVDGALGALKKDIEVLRADVVALGREVAEARGDAKDLRDLVKSQTDLVSARLDQLAGAVDAYRLEHGKLLVGVVGTMGEHRVAAETAATRTEKMRLGNARTIAIITGVLAAVQTFIQVAPSFWR